MCTSSTDLLAERISGKYSEQREENENSNDIFNKEGEERGSRRREQKRREREGETSGEKAEGEAAFSKKKNDKMIVGITYSKKRPLWLCKAEALVVGDRQQRAELQGRGEKKSDL